MSLAPIRRIYEITVDGRPVVFYSRFIGEVGRDIAAVKYALGDVYEADLQNRSEDDGTLIGSQWFTCEGDGTPLNSVTLATFDKRLQKSLMSFQLQNQLLIMNYYWERGGIVNAIQVESDLPLALDTMTYRFDADYGTISEATIAILHGWRPGSDASNISFVTNTFDAIEQIPEFLHEMYVDGTIQADGTMISKVYDYNQSKDNEDNVATDFDAQAASYRKWKDRIVANAIESGAASIDVNKLRDMERYIKYRSLHNSAENAITGATESRLYTATREVLGILEDLAPEDISPERREALIAAAVEPNHLTQVVPFLITNLKIGFFDRTEYSFQNLPDFDGISEQEQSNLVSLALPKVLEFYNKQMPDSVDPELIKFVDLRAPSLRPGDVYRAFFHINKQILDSLGDAEIESIAEAEQVTNSSIRIGDLRQELEHLVEDIESEFCTEGKTLDDEQARIQYEKYRSFASKKKLEISREITQKLIKSRDPSNNVDGLDLDLGVFGRAHLNQNEINSLIGDVALGITGWNLFEDETAATDVDENNPSLKIKISYGDLRYKISEVSQAFIEFSKDFENYKLKKKSNIDFRVEREVRFLREFTDGIQNLVRTRNIGKSESNKINLSDNSTISISFIPIPGRGSSLNTILIDGKPAYPIKDRSSSSYANSLKRSRTVHYIRNIEDMYSELEEGLLSIFKGGTCDKPGPKKGTGAAYILRYTLDVSLGSKQNEHTFWHAWGSEIADNALDTLGVDDLDLGNWSVKGEGSTFIPSFTLGFEKTLPSLGENCIKKENRKAVMKMIKKTFSMKRILCEYIKCLGLPGVQAQVPNIPKLKWPKLPALFDSSWEDFVENAKEIGSRLACMFLKGILDILQSPMCEERFIEGIFGAASAQAPEVKRALASGFLDTGIPSDKQKNAKDLIDALMEMLSPRELCALLNGEAANDEVYQIVRTIAESLGLGTELQTREQISNFFITIGFFVGPGLCEELSRFDSKIETCDEIYSLAAQIRSAAAKGEAIDPSQVQAAIDHAEKQLQDKADGLNFLLNGGSLQDLLPDFTSIENNPAFSKPNPRTARIMTVGAESVLSLAEMAFVSSLNGYVESYFHKEAKIAQPGDPEYNYQANMAVQRAVCNLKSFSEFELDLEDFASEQTTIRLRRAILILCNDYEKKNNSVNPDQQEYTLSIPPDPNTNQPVPNLLQGSMIEKYDLQQMRSADQANFYATFSELQSIWSMMFPISCGDLDGSTRTISSLKDWVKDIFFGGDLTPADISTLNTSYLNKINQLIQILQDQITNNIEKAFTTRNENLFLFGVKEFYDPQEVQDGKADDLITVKMDTKLETVLKHPITDLRPSMQVELSEDFGPGGSTDVARTQITIKDNFFLGSKDDYVVQYCEKIPSHLIPSDTSILPRPAAYRKILTSILKSKYQTYKTGDGVDAVIGESSAKRSFLDAYEGLYEQIAAGVRTSRIFSDSEYRERMDLKLRGKYYFDPKSGCFKNSKSRPSFGVLNFEKLITSHFPDEYLKEFANPLNSPLTEDYTTPGAFEKALMNVTLAGFIRMCLIEVLLKGALTISVWDIDFIKSNKIYRDYLVEFVSNQMDLQNFFTDNAEFRDDTIQRLSATSNIQYGRRKIILKELDGVISSLSKEVFENDAGYDFSQWFMDSIPFVQVPNTRARDGNSWLTNVDFNYFDNLKNNNFVFLEDYMRINGSIRSFRSSRQQIATAQLEALQSKMADIRVIDNTVTIPGGPVNSTNISSYNIGDASSVSLEGVYDDTDKYANTELMSVNEFSELIKSLVDNNAELSRYFHKLSGKTYNPGSRVHGFPDILSRGRMPSRIVKRTRQHVTFDKANIFSLLLKKRPDNNLGNGEKAIDKFIDHHYGTCQQDKNPFLFNVLTTGEYGDERYQTYSEAAAADLISKAFKFAKKSEDRYYVTTTNADAVLAQEEEYRTVETDTDLKGKDIGNDFKTRTGATYYQNPEKTIVLPPVREDTLADPDDLSENLNFKVANYKSGNNDPALRERTEGKNITRRSSGNTENLFHTPANKTTKEQYDFLLEENPDLPSEIWEETVIDLVGDSAPIFMFAGDSGWIPKDHMTDEQKKLIGKKLKNTHKWIDNGQYGRLDRWTKGIIKKLYECNLDTPEVIDPKRCHFTNVFAWDDTLPTGAGGASGLTPEVRAQKEKAFPIKPFGSAYGTKWSAKSAFDKCFGKMTRVYYKNDITFKKNPIRGNYDLTYPNEMLTPNEYKIPLRILITQVKNREGQVLKVFVRYILPQFLDFENEGLNSYRAQKMTDACVDTCDGWFNFIKESFKKVMTGWYASGDDRYETWKNLLTNPADPLNSGIRWSIGALDALRQGGDDTAHPFPPWTVGTNRNVNSNRDNSWWGSRQGAWCSSSKLYSHACRLEADNKEGNFQESESFIDDLFDDPGNLLRKPGNSQISADPIEAYNSFRSRLVGSFSGAGQNSEGNVPNPTPGGLPDDHTKCFDMHIKEMFMHYNLSKHSLYDHSLHQTLRIYTGIMGESQTAVPNSGTTVLQTIGNLVSWFSQKRSDSFWGRTSIQSNRWKTVGYGDDDIRSDWKSSIPGSGHKYERQWELQQAENNRCGPSLFYNDMRAPTTTMIYNALQHFSNADREKFVRNLYRDNRAFLDEGNGAKRQSWEWLLKSTNQINAYAYLYNTSHEKHYDENMTELMTKLFLDSGDQLIDPGHDNANFYIQHNDHRHNPVKTGNYFYWNLSDSDAKKMNMYMHPSEVPPQINGYITEEQAAATIKSALNDELIDYKRHVLDRILQSPNLASSILSRWNAALDEIGLTEIIREVTTGYTSRLEGDETIISDILEQSDISYGLRMSMHSTTDSGNNQNNFDINTTLEILWTDNSDASEEERCGKMKITTPDDDEFKFYTIPIVSHEFPLASIECFQATNLMLLEQKIKEIQPQMKKSLIGSQEYKDFFEFILPYKTMATSLTIHGTTLLAGYGEMPLLLSSTKTALASAFASATLVDPRNDKLFGKYPKGSDILASFGSTGLSGGEDPDCFDVPDLGEWLKMLMEMIKEFIKYFPSVVLRGISDQIDPMYKEMKRHYLACEIGDLRNGSWTSYGGRYSKTPLGLHGDKSGEKEYLPVNINFPVDLAMGFGDYISSNFTDPTRLLLSMDRLIGYIFGGPLPLLDGAAAFKIPCAKIGSEMDSWSKYKLGLTGRYGHSLTPLNFFALMTLELPRDKDLRRSICQSREIPNPIICDDEE